jgi:hypothetical protein
MPLVEKGEAREAGEKREKGASMSDAIHQLIYMATNAEPDSPLEGAILKLTCAVAQAPYSREARDDVHTAVVAACTAEGAMQVLSDPGAMISLPLDSVSRLRVLGRVGGCHPALAEAFRNSVLQYLPRVLNSLWTVDTFPESSELRALLEAILGVLTAMATGGDIQDFVGTHVLPDLLPLLVAGDSAWGSVHEQALALLQASWNLHGDNVGRVAQLVCSNLGTLGRSNSTLGDTAGWTCPQCTYRLNIYIFI